jgi:hypothetical protein
VSEVRRAMNTSEQIVRELAESDPIVDVGGIEENHYICVWCDAGHDSDGFRTDYSLRAEQQEQLVRNDYRSDCLWLRARRAVNSLTRPDDTCDQCHGQLPRHTEWLPGRGRQRLCYRCFVERGYAPADWHEECMRVANEAAKQ